jgi:hypothetical protein
MTKVITVIYFTKYLLQNFKHYQMHRHCQYYYYYRHGRYQVPNDIIVNTKFQTELYISKKVLTISW